MMPSSPGSLRETEFYDRLAASFDVMTDWHSRLEFELPFIQTILARRQAKSVLDVACGTGWHAIALAQRGYRAAGSDASAAMIARAQQNAERAGLALRFSIARFEELDAVWDEQFDAILCLGNSFPHVLSDDAALGSLTKMRGRLRAGGALVLHNLNYDRRLQDKPRWFGVNSGMVEGKETLIWRFADYGGDLITFNIALFSKGAEGNWSVDVQSTLQRPYLKSELESLLQRSGFGSIKFFGNLRGEAFDPAQSGDVVAVGIA